MHGPQAGTSRAFPIPTRLLMSQPMWLISRTRKTQSAHNGRTYCIIDPHLSRVKH